MQRMGSLLQELGQASSLSSGQRSTASSLMRRSGTVEAIAGGATRVGLAAKMANSIDRSNTLQKTCALRSKPPPLRPPGRRGRRR